MKVLLDENLPHSLRLQLTSHDVSTAHYMGWRGLKNGELLKVAEAGGFEVLLTGDQNLVYQQNLTERMIAIVVLTAIDPLSIGKYLREIADVVSGVEPGSWQVVECS